MLLNSCNCLSKFEVMVFETNACCIFRIFPFVDKKRKEINCWVDLQKQMAIDRVLYFQQVLQNSFNCLRKFEVMTKTKKMFNRFRKKTNGNRYYNIFYTKYLQIAAIVYVNI